MTAMGHAATQLLFCTTSVLSPEAVIRLKGHAAM